MQNITKKQIAEIRHRDAVARGKKGGKATSKRGKEYFAEIGRKGGLKKKPVDKS